MAFVTVVGTSTPTPRTLAVRVIHLGRPLEPATIELLGSTLSDDLETIVVLTAVSIPDAEIDLSALGLAGLAPVAVALANASEVDSVSACVTEPAPPPRGAPRKADKELLQATRDLVGRFPRVTSSVGEKLTVRFVVGTCPPRP